LRNFLFVNHIAQSFSKNFSAPKKSLVFLRYFGNRKGRLLLKSGLYHALNGFFLYFR